MKQERAPLTVWVPPGVAPLVSEGVRVSPIVPGKAPRVPQTAGRERSSDPATDSGWRNRGRGVRQGRRRLDASGGWNKREADEGPKGPDETLSVPPEILETAQVMMRRYDMKVGGMQLLATKSDKGGAIWRIETDHGTRSLKVLHREKARSLFSVGAQEYLHGRGARVPGLIKSKDGLIYAEDQGGKLWIVTDWIEPLIPATKADPSGAAALCYGLGEFHRLSQGYVPPPGAQRASRLFRWPKTYEKTLTKIGWFRHLAKAYPEMPASASVLAAVEIFEKQAQEAVARLAASPYQELVARGETAHGIVHQDYGWSNGQIGPGGKCWIIDLDGVAYDLGIRDLRKLIASTMDDLGTWDLSWILPMIQAYHEANPIEPAMFQVLLTDFSLPNEFYKHVNARVTKTVDSPVVPW